MPWRPLERCRDRAIPKLHGLRLAAAAGLRVPDTVWAPAAEVLGAGVAPPASQPWPLIVRSASPTEDTSTTSNAGQLRSVVAERAGDFARALAEVLAALPRDAIGRPSGAVLVQPWLRVRRAGVAVFDGFYWECAWHPGANTPVTGGTARGAVTRGHVQRDDPWSAWLERVRRASRIAGAIDVEMAEDDAGLVLLQVRPALFPVRRNPTVSLANHREVLGEHPSPWIRSALVTAGSDAFGFFAAADPAVGAWREPYALERAGRAWLNVSAFFRCADRWGLPRRVITAGIGGGALPPADGRIRWRRLVVAIPRLLRLQCTAWRTVRRAPVALVAFDRQLVAARELPALFAATVAGLRLALRTNFGLALLAAGLPALSRRLGLAGRPRALTGRLWREFEACRHAPVAARAPALAAWLARWGHRGPLESDPAHPRFDELRAALAAECGAAPQDVPKAPPRPAVPPPPAWRIAARREWFRDALMHRWRVLRARLLAAGEALVARGRLERRDDVFWLQGGDLAGDLRAAVARHRAACKALAGRAVPATIDWDSLDRPGDATGPPRDRRTLAGVALQPAVVTGRAWRVESVADALARASAAPAGAVLVVRALEPAWAVLFGRVAAVVAELGGELSHAAILLREARLPALLDCAGVFEAVRDGERVRVDGARGLLERLDA